MIKKQCELANKDSEVRSQNETIQTLSKQLRRRTQSQSGMLMAFAAEKEAESED